MTTKLQEVMELDHKIVAERAGYAITVQAAFDAGTLEDPSSAKRLLHEMIDNDILDAENVPAEVKEKLIEAVNELISEL